MKPIKLCEFCRDESQCACKSAIDSFFRLLLSVNARVLSHKPSSRYKTKAGVDKLNGYFQGIVESSKIQRRAAGLGIQTRRVFLRDRRPYLQVGSSDSPIHFGLSHQDEQISTIVSNPNRFRSWSNYIDFYNRLVSPQESEKLVVSRLDLNIDFDLRFTDLIQKVDIRNKRDSLTFSNSGGSRTGLIVGKGLEQIVIYNKSSKDDLEYPVSRVELRLKGSKLPSKYIGSIPVLLKQRDFFGKISLVDIEYKQTDLLKDQKDRLEQFKLISSRDGFYSAKKAFSVSRNFKRDFKDLLLIQESSSQPNEIFKNQIQHFLDGKETPNDKSGQKVNYQ